MYTKFKNDEQGLSVPYFREHWPECGLTASGVAIALIGVAALIALLYRGGVLFPHRVTFGVAIGGLGGGFALAGVGGAIFLFRKPRKETTQEIQPKPLPFKDISSNQIFPAAEFDIPVDIARYILRYLDFSTIVNLAMVNHSWRSIVNGAASPWRESAFKNWQNCLSGEIFRGNPELEQLQVTTNPVSAIVASRDHILTKKHEITKCYKECVSEFTIDENKVFTQDIVFEITEGAKIVGNKLVYLKNRTTCTIVDLRDSSHHDIASECSRFYSVYLYKDQIYIGTKGSILVYSLDGVLNQVYQAAREYSAVTKLFVDDRGIVSLSEGSELICIFDHNQGSPKTTGYLLWPTHNGGNLYCMKQKDALLVSSDEIFLWGGSRSDSLYSISRHKKNAPIELWEKDYDYKPMVAHENVLIGRKGSEFQIRNTKTKEILNTIDVGLYILSIAMRGSEILVSTKDNKLLSYKWS